MKIQDSRFKIQNLRFKVYILLLSFLLFTFYFSLINYASAASGQELMNLLLKNTQKNTAGLHEILL